LLPRSLLFPYTTLFRSYAAAAALTLLVAALLWAGPALLRPDVFDGDAAHHVWWLYRYADPTLFPGDVMFDYFRTSAPLGYRAFRSEEHTSELQSRENLV